MAAKKNPLLEYLPFLLGQEFKTPEGVLIIDEYHSEDRYKAWATNRSKSNTKILDKLQCCGRGFYLASITPLLRPFSAITKQELIHVMEMCYQLVYDHKMAAKGIQKVHDEKGGGLKAYENVNGRVFQYGLTIEKSGVLFSVDGAFMNIPFYKITLYLSQIGIDVFSLIESGIAIDKTTFKK